MAFEQLKREAQGRGPLRSRPQARSCPSCPRRSGIVTSPTGAAEVRSTSCGRWMRRFARLHVLIYPARVQGDGAADEIVAGIDYLAPSPTSTSSSSAGGGRIDRGPLGLQRGTRGPGHRPLPRAGSSRPSATRSISPIADFVCRHPGLDADGRRRDGRGEGTGLRRPHRQPRPPGRARPSAFFVQERRQEVLSLAQHRIFQNFRVRLFGLEQRVDLLESRAWEAVRGRQRQMAEASPGPPCPNSGSSGPSGPCSGGKRASWDRLAAGLHGTARSTCSKKASPSSGTGSGSPSRKSMPSGSTTP